MSQPAATLACFAVFVLVALGGVTLGCAGETADVKARFVSSRTPCTGDVKVVRRDENSTVPEDAPDRDKLLSLLAAKKPTHEYYDVHGCGGGAVFDCFDEISYKESGASRPARHCGPIASWTAPNPAQVVGVEYEATDGSTRVAPDETSTGIANKAAIASAVQDLPCDEASIRIAGTDSDGRGNVVEGCGVRAIYELVPYVPEGAPGRVAPAGLRYKLKARASIATGPGPAATGAKP